MSALPAGECAAVVYLVYNRPRLTAASFAAIRRQQPARLLVVADGPRSDRPDDEARCRAVRELIAGVDWPCEVERLYADRNLGCRVRISTGLDWAFSRVESAIVLEDDCVASPDFFGFCTQLLARYQEHDRVMHITGGQYGRPPATGASYYFSKYAHCWGWATWRRAWQHYDVDLGFWPELRASPAWRELMPDRGERRYWTRLFDRVAAGGVDTWDFQWYAAVFRRRGLAAAPVVNLVENIGIGPDATHTATDDGSARTPVGTLGVLRHPHAVHHDAAADRDEFARSAWGREARHRHSPTGIARAIARRVAGLGR